VENKITSQALTRKSYLAFTYLQRMYNTIHNVPHLCAYYTSKLQQKVYVFLISLRAVMQCNHFSLITHICIIVQSNSITLKQ